MFKHIIKILENDAKFIHQKYRKESTLNFFVSHLTAARKHQVQKQPFPNQHQNRQYAALFTPTWKHRVVFQARTQIMNYQYKRDLKK